MKFFKRLFAGPDEAGKLVDAGIKGIDAMFWTKEEKSAWVLKYMLATQTQNVARRFIAVLVIGAWLFFLVLAALAYPFLPNWSEYLTESIVGVQMTAIVGVIIGFYFLTHTIRSINGKK